MLDVMIQGRKHTITTTPYTFRRAPADDGTGRRTTIVDDAGTEVWSQTWSHRPDSPAPMVFEALVRLGMAEREADASADAWSKTQFVE